MSVSGPAELLQDTAQLRWIPIVAGIDYRLLFKSRATGRWTVVVWCDAGAVLPAHTHTGAGPGPCFFSCSPAPSFHDTSTMAQANPSSSRDEWSIVWVRRRPVRTA